MSIRYGGADSNEALGLRITVEAPATASPTAPVLPGSIWKLGGTDADGGGHKLVALVAGDDPDEVVFVQAAERANAVGPMTVNVISKFSQIRRFAYTSGGAPTIGQSITTAAIVTNVVGQAYDGSSYVLYVDTANLEVEVLC